MKSTLFYSMFVISFYLMAQLKGQAQGNVIMYGQYGDYSVEVPAEWRVKTEFLNFDLQEEIDMLLESSSFIGADRAQIFVDVWHDPISERVEGWVERMEGHAGQFKPFSGIYEYVTAGRETSPALKFSVAISGETPYDRVVTKHGSKVFVFTYYRDDFGASDLVFTNFWKTFSIGRLNDATPISVREDGDLQVFPGVSDRAQQSCCGIDMCSGFTNQYNCTDSKCKYANCVWWANYVYSCTMGQAISGFGGAGSWLSSAKAKGYCWRTSYNSTDVKPSAITHKGGHVAEFKSYSSSNQTIEIKQMDCYKDDPQQPFTSNTPVSGHAFLGTPIKYDISYEFNWSPTSCTQSASFNKIHTYIKNQGKVSFKGSYRLRMKNSSGFTYTVKTWANEIILPGTSSYEELDIPFSAMPPSGWYTMWLDYQISGYSTWFTLGKNPKSVFVCTNGKFGNTGPSFTSNPNNGDDVIVAPNPASNSFTLEYKPFYEIENSPEKDILFDICLVDMGGSVVLNRKNVSLNTGQVEVFNTETLPSGQYNLQLTGNNGVFKALKVVINK